MKGRYVWFGRKKVSARTFLSALFSLVRTFLETKTFFLQ